MAVRDGLQNEKALVPTSEKIRLTDMLTDAGFSKIEVTSFVSPKWVPQMADASDVMAGILRRPGVKYTALAPNLRGYEGAVAAKADEVAIFASASEGFSKANINCTIDESLERFQAVMEAARRDAMPVRGYVSCITDCPYDGPTPPEQVARIAGKLFKMGCREISLGDTIGHGTPETVTAMLNAVKGEVPVGKLAGHFHDTKGRAIDNIAASLEAGLLVFDAAAGGLGGCPYAPGAKGNVATEAVVEFVEMQGFATGIDRNKLEQAAIFARSLRGRESAND